MDDSDLLHRIPRFPLGINERTLENTPFYEEVFLFMCMKGVNFVFHRL
jgi:hypothetical protein